MTVVSDDGDGGPTRPVVLAVAPPNPPAPTSAGNTAGWFLGEQTRNKGSIHSDIWVGTAADLTERGVIGVYPVSGWWKDQPKRDRSRFGARYALVVSIETDAEGIDIWTPVAQQIGVLAEETPVEV